MSINSNNNYETAKKRADSRHKEKSKANEAYIKEYYKKILKLTKHYYKLGENDFTFDVEFTQTNRPNHVKFVQCHKVIEEKIKKHFRRKITILIDSNGKITEKTSSALVTYNVTIIPKKESDD